METAAGVNCDFIAPQSRSQVTNDRSSWHQRGSYCWSTQSTSLICRG